MSDMHECFRTLNDHLSAHNVKLAFGMQITADMDMKLRLLVGTEKINTAIRKPGPHVVASHCPFCGAKLEGGAA
jgi:hypothetical protein